MVGPLPGWGVDFFDYLFLVAFYFVNYPTQSTAILLFTC